MFLVPVLINAENGISLSYINCWGAALWSGLLVSGYTLSLKLPFIPSMYLSFYRRLLKRYKLEAILITLSCLWCFSLSVNLCFCKLCLRLIKLSDLI